jgi:hypothetical protein
MGEGDYEAVSYCGKDIGKGIGGVEKKISITPYYFFIIPLD